MLLLQLIISCPPPPLPLRSSWAQLEEKRKENADRLSQSGLKLDESCPCAQTKVSTFGLFPGSIIYPHALETKSPYFGVQVHDSTLRVDSCPSSGSQRVGRPSPLDLITLSFMSLDHTFIEYSFRRVSIINPPACWWWLWKACVRNPRIEAHRSPHCVCE